MPFDNANLDETTRLLRDARNHIERGWCRGVLARDKEAVLVHPTDKRAVEWCLYGALMAAGMMSIRDQSAIHRLMWAIGGGNLVDFNNNQEDSAPVLAAFDLAIAN